MTRAPSQPEPGRAARRWLVVALLAALALAPRAAAAQGSCTVNGQPGTCTATPASGFTLVVGNVVSLSSSAAATALPTPGVSDFTTGYTDAGGPTLTIRANAPWRLEISAASPTWSATSTSATTPAWMAKPAGDLRWATSPAGPFASLGTTPAALQSGSATGGVSVAISYRTTYALATDTPGNYSLDVVYTLTSP